MSRFNPLSGFHGSAGCKLLTARSDYVKRFNPLSGFHGSAGQGRITVRFRVRVSIPSRGFTGLQVIEYPTEESRSAVSIPSRGFTGLQAFVPGMLQETEERFQSPLGVSRVCRVIGYHESG